MALLTGAAAQAVSSVNKMVQSHPGGGVRGSRRIRLKGGARVDGVDVVRGAMSTSPRSSLRVVVRDDAGDASRSCVGPTGRNGDGSMPSWVKRVGAGAAGFVAAASLVLGSPGGASAGIIDPRAAEAGKCLLSSCQLELAGCLADEKCAESLVCLQTCFGRPDEADCQIKCGDLYASKAVQTFNTCAVTNKKCVKQKQDTGEYPVPSFDALATGFDTNVFGDKKRWYIVAGLNKDFDVFDCQEHFFSAEDKDHMAVKINWRVNRPNGQFYERSDIQTFYADENSSAVLHNNGNEYLHYQDDWYIPGFKEGEYVYVYYRGTNDAWDGYGGAVVYSTKPALDQSYVPELRELSKKVGVKWEDFIITDNSCKAAEPLRVTRVADLDTLGDDVRAVEAEIGRDVRQGSRFVGKEARLLSSEVGKDVRAVEKEVGKDARALSREVGKDARLVENELEKDIEVIEKDIVDFERKLVSIGPRFTFFDSDDALGKEKLKMSARMEKKNAERSLSKVEREVRAADQSAQ